MEKAKVVRMDDYRSQVSCERCERRSGRNRQIFWRAATAVAGVWAFVAYAGTLVVSEGGGEPLVAWVVTLLVAVTATIFSAFAAHAARPNEG